MINILIKTVIMHRLRKLSITAARIQSELLLFHHKPSNTQTLVRNYCAQTTTPTSNSPTDFYSIFADKWASAEMKAKEDLCSKVTQLRKQLAVEIEKNEDEEELGRLLEEKGSLLFRVYPDGEAFVELLHQLYNSSLPDLALKVANWRRRQADCVNPITSEEYAKIIWLAGRMKYLDLATEFFAEACNRRIKTSSTYNALMAVYMWHGLSKKCHSLFQNMKMDLDCSPTIVTYNILISVFGRSMLLDHMEAIFQEVKDLNISPTLGTYNNLIAGYVTTWMWDKMEETYMIMKASNIKPNLCTQLLMLRGYANSNQLEKMEEMYNVLELHVKDKNFALIRAMICAYCKSSDTNRVQKIEALLELIPEDDYRPWLNVLLIRLYAKESLLDGMESSIEKALKHNTAVASSRVMRSIVTNYYQNNSVDKLAAFVKRAEAAGWKLCRSLYHCLMVMYAAQNRLDEMESVLEEMEKINLDCSKRTLSILYEAYVVWGQRDKVHRLLGLMCKQGYGIPMPLPVS